MDLDNRIRSALEEARRIADSEQVPPFRPNRSWVKVAWVAAWGILSAVIIGWTWFQWVDPLVGSVPDLGSSADKTDLQLALPNGDHLEVSFPAELGIDTWQPTTSMVARLDEGEYEGCGALLVGRPRATARFLQPGDPLMSLTGRGGNQVTVGYADPSTAAHIYTVFEVDDWVVGIPFSAGDACPPLEISPIWADVLVPFLSPEGYPVIEVHPPARIDLNTAGGPHLILTNPDDRTQSILVGRAACTSAHEPERLPFGQSTAILCEAGGNVQIRIEGDQAFVEASYLQVSVEDFRPAR